MLEILTWGVFPAILLLANLNVDRRDTIGRWLLKYINQSLAKEWNRILKKRRDNILLIISKNEAQSLQPAAGA